MKFSKNNTVTRAGIIYKHISSVTESFPVWSLFAVFHYMQAILLFIYN